jgi:hypothetical protein
MSDSSDNSASTNGKSKARLKRKPISKERIDSLQELRQSQVLGLHAKGLNQAEIAHELNVDQATISRDLNSIKKTAKNKVVDVTDNLSFEFMKYLKAIDQMIREASRIASTEIDPHESSTMIDPNVIVSMNMNNKNRIQAIQLQLELFKHRFEVITGGVKATHDHSGLTLIDHSYDIKQGMKTPEERQRDQARLILGDLASDMPSLK